MKLKRVTNNRKICILYKNKLYTIKPWGAYEWLYESTFYFQLVSILKNIINEIPNKSYPS